MYTKFKQQLERNQGGWYQTGIAQTKNKVPINRNKSGSLGRLKSLLKRIEQYPETFNDQVIREFFLPHRPVIRQNTKSTNLRVVYDPLAKSESGYSLNDFLEKGPSFQNKSWDILITARFRPSDFVC